MRVGRLLTAREYYLEPISKELINKYKSKENMLCHARFIPSRSKGYMMFDIDNSKPIGYIIWEDDFIVAFEIFKDYRSKGYGKSLLSEAIESGANKLSVDKKNLPAINLYKKLGFKNYKETDKMYFMELEN